MAAFTTNRALLNSKFEGYKLDPLSQEDCVHHYTLPSPGVTQSTVSSSSQLSFPEVQSRIRHNHLAAGYDGRFAYGDKDGGVVVIVMSPNEENQNPTFYRIFDVPQPIQTDSGANHEYPAVRAINPNTWSISDGAGRLYIVQTTESPSGVEGNLLALYELTSTSTETHSAGNLVPFRLHNIVDSSAGIVTAVLTTTVVEVASSSQGSTTTAKPKRKISFDLIAVNLQLPNEPDDAPQTMNIAWRLRGDDIPAHILFDPGRGYLAIAADSPFQKLGVPTLSSSDPSPDELAPIPRADENLDAEPVGPEKPPPYSWNQTTDTVTVAFPLPSSTPKSNIHVRLAATTLTIVIAESGTPLIEGFPIPRYEVRKFWDRIDASASFWTWDREGEKSTPNHPHTVGLLTLHLEKGNEGTKWPHVFAEGQGEVEVLETVDPSEMWLVREQLEKYTAALASGEDMSGLGLGRGAPSLAEGEMDEEVDAHVGRRVVLTWVKAETGDIVGNPQKGLSIDLLSSPLPITVSAADEGVVTSHSLVTKNDIDGLYYTLLPPPVIDSPSTSIDPPTWTHTDTYPALAFVLATKRDTRFVFHQAQRAVMAFESAGGGTSGNVYVYRGSKTRGAKWAQQAVLKVGGGSAGTVLGVGGVRTKSGAVAVVCLCEAELVVLRGVF